MLSQQQYGFRNNHSTSLAITDLYENLLRNLDNKLISCAVFLDLRKAFDSVNHSILLTKLEHYGIRGNALNPLTPTRTHILALGFLVITRQLLQLERCSNPPLIQSYLSNRKQYVQGGNIKSSLNSIISGVPQGSILGPLFFLTFINDLPKSNSMKSILFADDTALVHSDNNLGKLQNSVNHEMTKVVDWLIANKLTKHFQNKIYVDHKQTCEH